jgi:HD-GYP domain-containing protein (c-di-GMP phosphodiesterase class II)/DNA-binding CsgD family transcriptional regulator
MARREDHSNGVVLIEEPQKKARQARGANGTPQGWSSDLGPDAAAIALGLEAGLRARAPGVHASTPMVRELAVRLCRTLGLGDRDERLVSVCARVRDVGMLALPDSVVLATGPLEPADWELVNRHPVLGSELLRSTAGLEAAAPVVRSHHERWDGEGYPDGLKGKSIPLLSRVIAACDAFVAMASDRPHRRGVGTDVALDQLVAERGRQLDPEVVDALVAVITETAKPVKPVPRSIPDAAEDGGSTPSARHDLPASLARFDVLPAFGPALDRLLAATDGPREGSRGDVVAAIESDTGLTVAVLRAAQGLARRRPITNVSDSVAALGLEQIREATAGLPRAAFPWQSALEAVMHQLRVHAQSVSRAAQRIAHELEFRDADDLMAVALLHDVGKLVLGPGGFGSAASTNAASATPEKRVQAERQTTGLDHASVGGLLLGRWGLPRRLSAAVAAHHSSAGPDELATLVRLADMVAHQAHGDPVDRKLMLSLASSCGLSVAALRDVLFDLPHLGGSQRRRADPSPLSARETTILRRLGEGKLYKEIAVELELSTSTVRTHLHNIYLKLEVADRAQAVLRATEMGWI